MPGLGPPTLNASACTGCGICANACASLVLELPPGERLVHIAHPDWCNACGHCEALCPTSAIRSPLPLRDPAPQPGRQPAVHADDLAMLLRERRSVRNYRDEEVPRELVERVIDQARYTPTGTNSQNVNWLVVHGREQVAEVQRRVKRFYERLFKLVDNPLATLGVRLVAGSQQYAQLRDYLPTVQEAARRMEQGEDRILYHAPVLLLVHAERWDSCSAFNCDAALFSASLLAHSHGLGTCFNGFVQQAVENDRGIKSWLGIPRHHRCYMALGMGWPAVRYRRLVEREPAMVRWVCEPADAETR